MHKATACISFLAAIIVLLESALTHSAEPVADEQSWTATFRVDKAQLVPHGKNPYFSLEPGDFLVLEGDGEQLTITVLEQAKKVDGVETRVVEERELKNGKLAEVSRNFFAICPRTNGVYY